MAWNRVSRIKDTPKPAVAVQLDSGLPYRLPEKLSPEAEIEGVGAIYSLGLRGVFVYPGSDSGIVIEHIDKLSELPLNSKEFAEKHKKGILAAYKEYAIKNDPTGLGGIMKEILGKSFVRVHNLYMMFGTKVQNKTDRSLTAKVAEAWAMALFEDMLTDDSGKPCDNFFLTRPLPMEWLSEEPAPANTEEESVENGI